MRYFALAFIALFIGSIIGGLAVNALSKRSAYPKAVMLLLQSNTVALRRATEAGQCDADAIAAPLSRLYAISGEIDAAFLAADANEPRFLQLSREFRDVVQAQIDTAPADCTALGMARSAIGEACKACHQVYRS